MKPQSPFSILPRLHSWLRVVVVRLHHRLELFATPLLFLVACPLAAQTPVNFGSVALGAAGKTLPVTFTLPATATLGTPQVITQGAPNLDFTLATGGTCSGMKTAGTVCTMNAPFMPKFRGSRRGAVVLMNTSGNAVATTYAYGEGPGLPQIAFSPSPQLTIIPASDEKEAMDGAVNLFFNDFEGGTVDEYLAAGGYTTRKSAAGGFSLPAGIAVDGAGNILINDERRLEEIPASASGFSAPVSLPFGHNERTFSSGGIAADRGGNTFALLTSADILYEVFAAGGYTTANHGGSGDNTFAEFSAANGYTTVKWTFTNP